MPRIARNSFDTSFFHVIIQGINKEYIFSKNKYIEMYLNLMNKYKEENNISVLAYCIMNNHAHMLIYTKKIEEMTRFMHKINGIYAQYYNKSEGRVGVVFRNRYVSEPILNEKYLAQCIKYIHMNPVKAGIVQKCEDYKYSTCKEYAKNVGVARTPILIDTLGKDYLNWLNYSNDNIIFKDIENNKEEVFEEGIKMFENKINDTLTNILKNREKIAELIKFLKNNYKITYADMSKKFGFTRGEINYLKKDANETRPYLQSLHNLTKNK